MYAKRYSKKRYNPNKKFAKRSISKWVARKRSVAQRKGLSVYYFTRTATVTAIVSLSSTDTFNAFSFALSNVPNSTEFTALYDQYKINAVKLTFFPNCVPTINLGSASGAIAVSPRFLSVIDYDDENTVGLTMDTLRQYQSLHTTMAFEKHTRYIKPKFATEVYRSSIATAYGARNGWIDTAYPDVPHFGLKTGMEATTLGSGENVFRYKIHVKYYLSFRSVR